MASISRAQKVRLGIFVGAGLGVLFGAIMLLAGRALLETRDFYKVRFSSDNVSFSGLEPGSDVKYSGIKIGRVENLGIARDDVATIELTLSVVKGTPIAVSSRASLVSAGITGLKFVDLSRGTPGSALRKPGDTIPSGPSLLDELSQRATTVAAKLEELISNLKLMTGPETQQSVQQILSATAGIMNDNRQAVAEILADTRKVTTNVEELSRRGVQVAVKADRFMTDIDVAGNHVRKALEPEGAVGSALSKTDKLIERMNMLILRSEGDLDVTLSHLREASANISDFSLEIKENPTLLLNNTQPTQESVGR